MKPFYLFIIFLPFAVSAQVWDNFSDGDFTNNPAWQGDEGHFKISSTSAVPEPQRPALQLDAPAGGQSCLAVSCNLTGDLEWQFWLKMSLNTSSGNYARVYLLSDSPYLKTSLDGYFLQFGGSDDSVDFFRQDSLQAIHLLRLATLFTGNSTNAIRMRVTRSGNGEWTFSGDPLGTNLFSIVGETSDLCYESGNCFGIFFEYTGSNATKFYFDDFYAGPLIVDTVPPVLVDARAMNPSEIQVVFNEAVSLESAEDVTHYYVNKSVGGPYAAIRLLEPTMVELFFDEELENGEAYILEMHDIIDLAGNISRTMNCEVIYYHPVPFDIIITEIMADPSPPAGLPEEEYLEIYNRGPVEIDLLGWGLEIGSTMHELPSVPLRSGEYLILCGEGAVGYFQPYGKTIGLGSFVLSNGGTSLQIFDPSAKGIFYVEYDPSWYRNDDKSDGGYSLEMTDPGNPCIGAENWSASGHPDGGTPGRLNFNAGTVSAETRINGICPVSDDIIEIAFSFSTDSISVVDISRYLIDPGNFHPDHAEALAPDFRTVRLTLPSSASPGTIYRLSVKPDIKNCIGEEVNTEIEADFGIPGPPSPFDIVLNEILFNPLGDGVDYVEILNRSQKAILLNGLFLGSVRETPPNPPDTQLFPISPSCLEMLPGQYLVLSKDQGMVLSQYFAQNPGAFLDMSSFPSYNNDEGYVFLLSDDGTVIDGFHYSDAMHFIMLNSTEGVSLERICPDRLGDDAGNWHSAAETAGFGTPGYQNSQYLGLIASVSTFTLEPGSFSPDGDGVNDELGIYYQFDEPGKLITVMVFSSDGRLTRTLVNNEMPGTSGIFSWDGTMDDHTPAMDGIYVVYLEALGMDGRTSRFRRACALARRR